MVVTAPRNPHDGRPALPRALRPRPSTPGATPIRSTDGSNSGSGPGPAPGPAPGPGPGSADGSGSVAGAAGHGRNALPVAALAGHALVSTPRGTGLRTALECALAEAGVDPAVGVEAAAPPQLAELAAHGLGVAVLPDPGPLPGLRVRPLTGPVPRVRIALAWPADRTSSPPTVALVAHLRQAYPGPVGAQAPAGTQAPVDTRTPAGTAAPSAMCSSAAAPSSTSRSSGK
ncbi:LysR family transcriptional regulator substrate-binding protein [Kitasatospora sp. NPDC005856]|uniref:LysR family transcriptional regulator substrate-binding protein n=1 Tax=Kitasatospora sp. NPDC005856 TaxID=3154566 RepID=UPI00340F72F4